MTFGGQWSFLDYGQNLVENAKMGDNMNVEENNQSGHQKSSFF